MKVAEEILEYALKRPDKDRAQIAEALIASLDTPIVDEDVELAWQQEIAKRINDVESGAVKCIPWEELRDRLRQNAHVSG